MSASDELLAPVSPDVELCYQTFGDPSAEPLLLVMGLGGPMTWWDAELCAQLADAGFHVIRYDNRDTGRSSRSPVGYAVPTWSAPSSGHPPGRRTRSRTWPATPSASSTTSASSPPTSPACRWAG